MVFPNQVAALLTWRGDQDRSASGPVTICFGALNRETDWAPIPPALNRLLAVHEGLRVQVIYDRSIFDALATPHKGFEPLCSYHRSRCILGAADVALLPLEPTRINQHKSDLKFIECAAQGVVALASPTVYDRTIRHGETGVDLPLARRVRGAVGSSDPRPSVPPRARP
jgi:hypothetical protein